MNKYFDISMKAYLVFVVAITASVIGCGRVSRSDVGDCARSDACRSNVVDATCLMTDGLVLRNRNLIRDAVLEGGEKGVAGVSNLCDHILVLSSEKDRYRLLRQVIDETMQIDLSTICPGPVAITEEFENQRRGLEAAYCNMRMVVEEVFVRLFAGGAPPNEQLYPWLILIKKMKSEDLRMRSEISHSALYVRIVERRFDRCLREGQFKSEEEIREVSDLYYQIVGKQLKRNDSSGLDVKK